MHEESVARAILQRARETLDETMLDSEQTCTNKRTVSALTVSCGELSGVDPELLSLTLKRLCASSDEFVHCKCCVQQTPMEAHCSKCHLDFAPENFIFRCPCGSQNIQVIRGESVVLESLTVTDEH